MSDIEEFRFELGRARTADAEDQLVSRLKSRLVQQIQDLRAALTMREEQLSALSLNYGNLVREHAAEVGEAQAQIALKFGKCGSA